MGCRASYRGGYGTRIAAHAAHCDGARGGTAPARSYPHALPAPCVINYLHTKHTNFQQRCAHLAALCEGRPPRAGKYPRCICKPRFKQRPAYIIARRKAF